MLSSRWPTSSRRASCREPGIGCWIGTVVCACLIAFFSQISWANPLFGPKMDFHAGQNPLFICKAHWNRDGRIDLFTTHYTIAQGGEVQTDTFSVFLGNGDGTFMPRSGVYIGPGAIAAAGGDLNRDGQPDLAVTGVSPWRVSVLLGRGDGTFGPPADIAIPHYPMRIEVADLNQDGRLDVLVPEMDGPGAFAGVMVFLGNGDGTLGSPITYETVFDDEPNGIAVADLDLDGILDVVTANSGHTSGEKTVSVLLGRGDGTLQPQQEFAVGSNPGEVAVGDLDGDGNPDLAVTNESHYGGTWDVSVLLGRGDGTFLPKVDYPTGPWPFAIESADLDMDGSLDLAVSNTNYPGSGYGVPGPGSVSIFLGRGDGTFGARSDYPTSDNSIDLAVADFNGDGGLDLAVTNCFSNTISVLLNSSHEPVPVGVEDLEAVASEAGVRLSWGLSEAVQRDLGSVRVQRAAEINGPYADRTVTRLAPARHMSFDDVDASASGTYWYRLVLVLGNGAEVVAGPVSVQLGAGQPSRTALHQPLEPTDGGPIQIRFSIANAPTPARLGIFDVRGRGVFHFAPSQALPGEHCQTWDRRDTSGARVSRGVYVVRLEAGPVTASRKLIVAHR